MTRRRRPPSARPCSRSRISASTSRAARGSLRAAGAVQRRRRRLFAVAPGETLGLVGESRLRQIHGRLTRPAPLEPTAGRVVFGGEDITQLAAAELRPLPAADADRSSRTRMPPSIRGMTVGDIVAEPLAIHGIGAAPSAASARCAAARARRPRAGADRPLSARILRRPAPAHRHRPRARPRAAADRLRRAGLRARRVDPGADPQPAAGPAGRARPHLSVHRARPGGRAAHQPSRRGHVSRPDRGTGRRRGTLRARRCIPTPQALLAAVPVPDPARRQAAIVLQGDLPSPLSPPSGCPFHTRCPQVMPRCRNIPPALLEDAPGHWSACHLNRAA